MTCNKAYVAQTSRSLKQRYKEHTRYIRSNNPQSAYALHILNNQHKYDPIEKTMTLLKPLKNPSLLTPYALHILNNQHEYGPIEKTMTLLKPLKNPSLLTPYEHFFIQSLHKTGRLISEQNPSEPNPLLQLAINPSHPPTWPG